MKGFLLCVMVLSIISLPMTSVFSCCPCKPKPKEKEFLCYFSCGCGGGGIAGTSEEIPPDQDEQLI